MGRNEEMVELLVLREKITAFDEAENAAEQVAEAMRRAESRQPTALSDFDSTHMDTYVISQIGRAPVRPRESVKVTVVDRTKRRKFERESADYKKQYERTVSDYFQEYAEQRSKVEADELEEIAGAIEISKQQYEEALAKADAAKQAVDEDATLGARMKTLETIDTLIGYIKDRRADSVKEAVNLYYEEDHRKRLEEYAAEQVRVTKEASSIAREAALNAEKAAANAVKSAQRADEAVSQAKNALEMANEALRKAQDALEEADSVYIEALLKK